MTPPASPSIAVLIPTPCIDRYLTVSALPAAGWKVIGDDLGELDGGVTGNFAAAAARLGARVHAIGWAGTDPASRGFVDALRAEGVDVSLIEPLPGLLPYRTTVLVGENGERSVVLLPPGAGPDTTEPDWDDAMATLAPTLCFVGPWDSLAAQLARAARAAGSLVGATVELDARDRPEFSWSGLDPVDLLFVSQETAEAFGWSADEPARFPDAWADGPQTVVVTSGTDGARVVAPDDAGTDRVPAFRVEAVDATGAGDTFAAAFCTGWVEGLRGRPLLRWANAAGALATTALGPRAAMPTRAQVNELARRDEERRGA